MQELQVCLVITFKLGDVGRLWVKHHQLNTFVCQGICWLCRSTAGEYGGEQQQTREKDVQYFL